jgi:hypothetical protein
LAAAEAALAKARAESTVSAGNAGVSAGNAGVSGGNAAVSTASTVAKATLAVRYTQATAEEHVKANAVLAARLTSEFPPEWTVQDTLIIKAIHACKSLPLDANGKLKINAKTGLPPMNYGMPLACFGAALFNYFHHALCPTYASLKGSAKDAMRDSINAKLVPYIKSAFERKVINHFAPMGKGGAMLYFDNREKAQREFEGKSGLAVTSSVTAEFIAAFGK